jgi:hypothetical protein
MFLADNIKKVNNLKTLSGASHTDRSRPDFKGTIRQPRHPVTRVKNPTVSKTRRRLDYQIVFFAAKINPDG